MDGLLAMHAGNALVMEGACDGGCGPPVQSSMTKEEKSAAAMLTPEEGLPTSAGLGSPSSLPVGCFCKGREGRLQRRAGWEQRGRGSGQLTAK